MRILLSQRKMFSRFASRVGSQAHAGGLVFKRIRDLHTCSEAKARSTMTSTASGAAGVKSFESASQRDQPLGKVLAWQRSLLLAEPSPRQYTTVLPSEGP